MNINRKKHIIRNYMHCLTSIAAYAIWRNCMSSAVCVPGFIQQHWRTLAVKRGTASPAGTNGVFPRWCYNQCHRLFHQPSDSGAVNYVVELDDSRSFDMLLAISNFKQKILRNGPNGKIRRAQGRKIQLYIFMTNNTTKIHPHK